jgi:hypothetical protein
VPATVPAPTPVPTLNSTTAAQTTPPPSVPTPTSPSPAQTSLGASLAAFGASLKGISDTLSKQQDATTPDTSTGSLQDVLKNYLALSGQLANKGTDTQAAYDAQGVADKAQKAQDLTNQYNSREQYYNDQINQVQTQNTEGKSAQAIQEQVDQLTRQKNLELANIAIQQTAANGNLTVAKNLADQAIALKYQPITDQISALKDYYTMAKDDMTTSEQQQAAAAIAAKQKEADTQQQEDLKRYDYFLQYGSWPNDGSTPPAGISTADSTSGQGGVQGAINAIVGNESGGNYSAVSPQLPNGSRSYGKYQVLDTNIPAWTKQYYGQALTPQEFLNNPQAQDAVAQGRIGELWNQYGNINDVASVWFTGVPYAQAVAEGRKDQATGTTVQDYVAKAANAFNASGTTDTTAPGSVPTTAEAAMASTNPNDNIAYQLATGGMAPSQALTARNLSSSTSPAAKALYNRANAISMAVNGVPFSPADSEAAYKIRNTQKYQNYIQSAPAALRAVGEVMNNLKTIQDAGYLSNVKDINSLQLKALASGTEFWAPQSVKNAAAQALSQYAQAQDDIGMLLGSGQGSDAKIALSGLIFGQSGGLNTTDAVAKGVSQNITQKLQDFYSSAGISPNSPVIKAELARLQPSIDAINGTTDAAPKEGDTHVYNGTTYVVKDGKWVAQ